MTIVPFGPLYAEQLQVSQTLQTSISSFGGYSLTPHW